MDIIRAQSGEHDPEWSMLENQERLSGGFGAKEKKGQAGSHCNSSGKDIQW